MTDDAREQLIEGGLDAEGMATAVSALQSDHALAVELIGQAELDAAYAR